MPLITALTLTTAVCAPLSVLLVWLGIIVQHNCSREHTRQMKELIQLKKTQLYSPYENQIEGLKN